MKVIFPEPALLIEREKAVIIADLHMGFEFEYVDYGVHVPSRKDVFERRIRRVMRRSRARTLIVNGDLKHMVAGISFSEWKDVPELVESLSKEYDVKIVPGNHDGEIEALLPRDVEVLDSRGIVLEDEEGSVGIFHGHAWPSPKVASADCLVMGHVHPVVRIKGKYGFRATKPVWARGKVDRGRFSQFVGAELKGEAELVIMPAFNDFLGGLVLNGGRVLEDRKSPVLKAVELGEFDVYLLDGTYLGKINQFPPA